MANFQNNAITDAGRILLSHVQMGAVFEPTKIVLGEGYLPAGTTVRTIKDVVAPVKTLEITKKKRNNDGTVTVGGYYSNQDIPRDFYFRELALYAKATYPAAQGGQQIAEVLYSYGNAGDVAELMPAYTTGQPVERQMDIMTYIGNDTEINLTITTNVYVTKEELAEAMENAAGGFVIIEKGQDIPVAQRKEGVLYFRVMDSVMASVPAGITVTSDEPEMTNAAIVDLSKVDEAIVSD